MQYEDFKNNLLNENMRYFSCGLVIHSEVNMLLPIVKRIAAIVHRYGFCPPGDVFNLVKDVDIILLDYLLNEFMRYNSPDYQPEEFTPHLRYRINSVTFSVVSLIQVLLSGEGDVEIRKDKEEIILFAAILSNLLKIETLHRKGFGLALRKNYSLLCIDKPLFLQKG
jgi:hypothetical protein